MLGQALDRRSATAPGIFRYGHAVVPMDEARALVRDRRLRPARTCASTARAARRA